MQLMYITVNVTGCALDSHGEADCQQEAEQGEDDGHQHEEEVHLGHELRGHHHLRRVLSTHHCLHLCLHTILCTMYCTLYCVLWCSLVGCLSLTDGTTASAPPPRAATTGLTDTHCVHSLGCGCQEAGQPAPVHVGLWPYFMLITCRCPHK